MFFSINLLGKRIPGSMRPVVALSHLGGWFFGPPAYWRKLMRGSALSSTCWTRISGYLFLSPRRATANGDQSVWPGPVPRSFDCLSCIPTGVCSRFCTLSRLWVMSFRNMDVFRALAFSEPLASLFVGILTSLCHFLRVVLVVGVSDSLSVQTLTYLGMSLVPHTS